MDFSEYTLVSFSTTPYDDVVRIGHEHEIFAQRLVNTFLLVGGTVLSIQAGKWFLNSRR